MKINLRSFLKIEQFTGKNVENKRFSYHRDEDSTWVGLGCVLCDVMIQKEDPIHSVTCCGGLISCYKTNISL